MILKKTLKYNKVNLNSFLVSLMIVYNAIAVVINTFFSDIVQIGALLAIFILMLGAVNFILNSKKFELKIINYILYLILFFLCTYVLTKYAYTLEVLTYFMFFGIFAMLIGQFEVSVEKIFFYISCISSFVGIPILLSFSTNTLISGSLTMGFSYAILPISIFSIVHCLKFRSRKILWVGYITSFISVYQLVMHGTRGAVVAILVLIWFILFLDKDEERNVIKKTKRFILVLIPILVVFIMLSFSDYLINYLLTISDEFNLYFIRKSVKLLQGGGDISNGRIVLYDIAWQHFISSPIFGNGIGTFQTTSTLAQSYPHNIVLQVLYEGGILLALPLFIPILRGIMAFFKKNTYTYNQKLYFSVLFSISIIPLFFSNELWRYQLFWLLIAFLINNKNKNMRYKRINFKRG